MKCVLYGLEGWLGPYITKYLEGRCNLEHGQFLSPKQVREELEHHRPDCVICCIEKSYGKNVWSTSYIEDKLDVNLHYNLYIPTILAGICRELGIHYTYLGNGCIFRGSPEGVGKDDVYRKTLDDSPNLRASSHSIVTGYTDMLVQHAYPDCLYLRLRYPILGDFHPKCYITKLIGFQKILATHNSVTVLPDLLPILWKMLEVRQTGVYHLVNPGRLASLDTLITYKHTVDPTLQIEEMSEEEHRRTVGERSNGIVGMDALVAFATSHGIHLPDAQDSVNKRLDKMRQHCTPLEKCLCCQGIGLCVLLNLGLQPLANDFHPKNVIPSVYPLCLMYCPNCYHAQLSHAIQPSILFRNYKYVSGTSNTGRAFFRENAERIAAASSIGAKRVLDIASNDGSQLDCFLEMGWETYGVDPAENLCPIAEEKGHRIVCDFWTEEVADKLPMMDVITAQNVFAHTQYVDGFLQACKRVMHNETRLYLQTSQRDMIRNGEFDTTYHEHISFYNTNSMKMLLERNGLTLHRVEEHSIHGRSYIFEVMLEGASDQVLNTSCILEEERALGLFNPRMYEHFRLGAIRAVDALRHLVHSYRKRNFKIVGFGAAAKGQTLLCYGEIDMEYIVDENPLKIGMESPKLNIPIVSLESFQKESAPRLLVVILAWNFAEEIKRKVRNCYTAGELIIVERYFPEIVKEYFIQEV